MPGDLRDPEQTFPFYYDPRYREAPNPFEPGAFNIDEYLQSIVEETIGKRLSPDKLKDLKIYLEDKGFFHRNLGDESFREEVHKRIKRHAMARKIAHNYGRFK